jgi:hypothetical protein
MSNFQLGLTYTDKITGFTGVATGHVTYLIGSNLVLLNPKVDSEGRLQDSQWFDQQRLEKQEGYKPVVLDNGATPGPDKQAPKY